MAEAIGTGERLFIPRAVQEESVLAGKTRDRFRGKEGGAPWYGAGLRWSKMPPPKALARCLFVYPGVTSPGWASLKAGASNEATYMSHGMAYVSSALKARGHLAWLLDMRSCRSWPDFARRVAAEEYDLAFLGFLSHDAFTAAGALRVMKEVWPDRPVVVGGIHPTISEDVVWPPDDLADLWLRRDPPQQLRGFLEWKCEPVYEPANFPKADCVIWNEGEVAACMIAEEVAAGNPIPQTLVNAGVVPDLNETPHADRELFDTEIECQTPLLPFLPRPFYTITFGRGCPFACLAGDTKVNTIDGYVRIDELARRWSIGQDVVVWTRRKNNGSACLAHARNVMKTRENAALVRVRFDDGSYIDCTPDHRFMAFKWGNQHVDEREWETEAKDLRHGMHVRAIRREVGGPSPNKYVSIAWARRKREREHRIVMEFLVGRRLKEEEVVHHEDRNTLNNLPYNLELHASQLDHVAHHPEVAQRMRENNPTKRGVDAEWRRKLSEATKGRPKSMETRIRMRHAMAHRLAKRREYMPDVVNHRIESVEWLSGRADTYCMEVPGHDWFYAQDVLVHNCGFCNIASQLSSSSVRLIKPEYFLDELEQLHARHGKIGSLMIHDDILLYPKWLSTWNAEIRRRWGYLPYWCQMRADFITKFPDLMREMAEAGMGWVSIGLESGSQRLLDLMVKQTTVEQNVRACEILESLGVNVFGNWMLGLPTETPEDVKATADMMRRIKPGFHSASIYCDYPGTSLSRYLKENGLLLPEWYVTSHYPWQRRVKGVDYELAMRTRSQVCSEIPNRPQKPKLWPANLPTS